MASKEIAQQARVFLYELNNARHEYSFSSTDTWVFSQSTAKEKLNLENEYYPVLFIKCNPEDLPGLTGFFTDEKSGASSKERIYLVAHCLTKLKH